MAAQVLALELGGSSRDEQVIRALEPFESFYRRERRGLVALAYALSRSRVASEDLAQEALMAAYRNWERVGRLDQPAAWVRKVVANNSFSFLRRSRAELKATVRLVGAARWDPPPQIPEASLEMWDEVARLPRRQAQVVALYYVSGMTMVEIAEVLGCAKETVNTHLRRARARLAERFGSEDLS